MTKKLEGHAKKRAMETIRPWIKSISAHLYWAATSSGNDGELKRDKWKSVTRHIANIHEGHSERFPRCAHGQIDEREWMVEGKLST